MKYIILPLAKLIACVLMAQVAVLTFIIVLVWSLSPTVALEQAAFIWFGRYRADGVMIMAVYVAAVMTFVFRVYLNL